MKNRENFQSQTSDTGLTYDSTLLGTLVGKDTDGDGVADWEEFLWGTDPRKKDTNDDGVPDGVEIANLKKQRQDELGGNFTIDEANLTETDKFSREFFATVSALSQAGAIDEATIEKLSTSLADSIKNSTPKKIYTVADIKTTTDDSKNSIRAYSQALNSIYIEPKVNYTVLDVLQKFIVDEDTVDVDVLSDLDPIIEQINEAIALILKITVPRSIAPVHLEFLNATERLLENTSDIKLYERDVIVALSAISQYTDNGTALETAVKNLNNTISNKLSN